MTQTAPRMDRRIAERRRHVRVAAARRRRRRLASALAVLAVVGGAVALSYTPLFAVDEVRVVGVGGEQAEAAVAASGVAVGERLLSIDLAAATAAIEHLPWVRSVELRREPPSTVEIAVEPREPIAVALVGGSAWLLDEEGYVVAGGAREHLPVIDAPSAVLPGLGLQASDAALRNALAVEAGLPGPVRALVDRYDAPSTTGLRLHLVTTDAAGGIWVRFGRAERIDAKARAIGLLLEQARQQAAAHGDAALRIAELDVRAPDNPVVVPARDATP